jgi:hypothetical protein
MRGRILRRGLYVLLLGVGCAALLLLFAHPGAGVGWDPAQTHPLALTGFQSPVATVAVRESTVHAEGADAQGMTVLMQSSAGLVAAQWRHLHYSLESGSPARKYLLVWRSDAGPGVAPLPVPPSSGTIDLARHAAWQGSIEWLGVAAAPVDYLAASAFESPTLELRELRLDGPSWRGALAALWTEWSGARPWTGRSSNTAGFELSQVAGPSFTAFVASLLALAGLLAWLLLGRESIRRALPGLLVVAILLPGAWQVRQLWHRAAAASAAAGLAATRPQSPLAAQPQLAVAARRLSEQLKTESGRPRLLVHGANQFLGEYPVWLLREHDVAMLWSGDGLPPADAPGDWRVVLVGSGDWSYDAAAGRLRIGSQERAAQPFADLGVLKGYRLQPEGTP